MPKSLFFRLMGGFVLVIVVAMAVAYVIANQATTNEFRYFMFRGQMVGTQVLADELASYYQSRGSWEGVDALLARGAASGNIMGGGMMSGGMMGASLGLADAHGVLIAATDGSSVGRGLSSGELASGTPIRVNGQMVGTLFAPAVGTNAGSDPASLEFLNQVNRSLLLGGLAAAVIAVLLGSLLFRQITAPLGALAGASRRIAAGDLNARVQVRGEDEIASVGQAFNGMAGNLERSEAARRNMLADVAHELRNPLGVISSHLEAMLDGVFPANPEQIASLQDEILLLTRLVDDLRDLALADAGQLSLNRVRTDLRVLVERTANAFQTQATENHIRLVDELMTNSVLVNIDVQRIEQVLRNLLSNALRYTPADGTVKVRLSNLDGAARVEVTDSGPGIPEESLPDVFERFWRGDKARARARGGAGLGLSIARQWVQAHGGEIGVSSRVGQGTTFWFTLPLSN
jgi:two-component system sensor histidine kinase BaeS